MKTYISVGIGDMMCLDSVLTQEERNNITEIYWACRFGKYLIPLLDNNKFYPNLRLQHTICDKIGIEGMLRCDPSATNFWHFRPDFENNYNVGLSIFGLNKNEVVPIDAPSIFLNKNREFNNSSFLDIAELEDIEWNYLNIKPNKYILVHYPTSTRPRSDIATIDNNDWMFIRNLSEKVNLPIVVITDTQLNTDVSDLIVLKNPNIKSVIALCKFATFYAGCDSFVSILSCKTLAADRLFVKSHSRNIQTEVLSNTWLQRFFLPHSPEVISKFYKSYIGHG